MSNKIVGWLAGARDGKILGFKKKPGIIKKIKNKSGNGEYKIFAQKKIANKAKLAEITKKKLSVDFTPFLNECCKI